MSDDNEIQIILVHLFLYPLGFKQLAELPVNQDRDFYYGKNLTLQFLSYR